MALNTLPAKEQMPGADLCFMTDKDGCECEQDWVKELIWELFLDKGDV